MEMWSLVMFATLMLALLLGYPVAFTLGAIGLGFGLVFLDATFFNLLPMRVWGIMTNFTLSAVPLFVFMGIILEKSGLAEDLLETMGLLFGPLPGGLAISIVLVGALLAATTGVVGATVVTMGIIALPSMLKNNYSPELATGTIAASGTLGQIIPPSVILILLADVIGVPIGRLFIAAIVPGMILIGMYLTFIIIRAWRNPDLAPALIEYSQKWDLDLLIRLAKSLFPALFLIVAVLGSIFFGVASPTESAAVGAVGAMLLAAMRHASKLENLIFISAIILGGVIGWLVMNTVFFAIAVAIVGTLWLTFKNRLTRQHTVESMQHTVRLTSMVFLILIGATTFGLVFRGMGGDNLVHEIFTQLPGGQWGFLLISLALVFVLGFFLDFLEICFIVVPILAPIAAYFQIDLLWFAILIAVNLQTSFLTPPFGFSLFYLKAVAPSNMQMSVIYRGVMPFVILQVIGLAIMVAFPQTVLWLPNYIDSLLGL
ncbi:TRAP transporter large permease subunit [Candidatus Albibeggiatoa sp. nov. NOAA]|uniref:TRAP transporter large permease n=1 Tax=Candidatus Albibeggiatoa sp. nov. NOAA TaxID=3162724 RepID=UPI003303B467|nr:TRAP transporter large permease subunit [Thiotrichaceae bacterium]